ncbi:hypothetical protein HYPSUDRAFT_764849 [Hypholoma sublateritium FD-334 SS-4]|uniref:Uncharacterized protein n=1 Tax=Hypholoma sublateritium (strain FD-334 SS-4) TaxID=945553 RepID=A0A0D2MC41_HYPSF|nr:hypothetical protein HYPSUDRAFT_764849 [Hypholoma sublateritium FD-334 SS-4]
MFLVPSRPVLFSSDRTPSTHPYPSFTDALATLRRSISIANTNPPASTLLLLPRSCHDFMTLIFISTSNFSVFAALLFLCSYLDIY